EAQRAVLVGEYLGATAIKTNELVDAALGGVLFIDEAYSLVNDGEGHSDRFGNEAVQALLKRAEDDRDRLVIVLAGYDRQMEDFLASNPGLNSRFAIRIRFAGSSPPGPLALARGYAEAPTLDSALAELDELIGLEPVKRQVHEIAAQLRVARLRDAQGLASQPPARHFVFTGPPGTGKTTVARILGRIFAALGLLVRPEVTEAHRADLVGEHLGSTALKSNRLVDSALGGVLFGDEAFWR